MTVSVSLDRDQAAVLTRIAHEGVLTYKTDGRWSVKGQRLQQYIETLGGHWLLTTEPVATNDVPLPDMRVWRLAAYGAVVHAKTCSACHNQSDRRAA